MTDLNDAFDRLLDAISRTRHITPEVAVRVFSDGNQQEINDLLAAFGLSIE